MLTARYSSGSSGSAPCLRWASNSACFASKASEMYLRKIRPRTTCLYSAASMLLRSASAAAQSFASKPRLAVVSFFFRCGTESPRTGDRSGRFYRGQQSGRDADAEFSPTLRFADRENCRQQTLCLLTGRRSLQSCGKQTERERVRVLALNRSLVALSVDSP